tara:strand:- start:286 stop:471 length:186 start_codon:yes stop_codon:yes gene_type:complete
MYDFKMPTKKSYVGNDIGSRVARTILDTSKNYSQMGDRVVAPAKTNATKGRNNPRGAKGAR